MTYLELLRSADRKLDNGSITIGEYEEMLEPLRREVQSVQPEQKMGKWITKDRKEQGYDITGMKTWYIQILCDKCGFIKTAIEGHTGQYKFCPNCGAKMEEGEHGEIE